jgi:hypothetical protein
MRCMINYAGARAQLYACSARMLTSDAGETLTRASGFCCDRIGAVALDRSQRVEGLLVRTSALLIFPRSLLHILANLAMDAAVSVENRQPAAITNMLQHCPVSSPATGHGNNKHAATSPGVLASDAAAQHRRVANVKQLQRTRARTALAQLIDVIVAEVSSRALSHNLAALSVQHQLTAPAGRLLGSSSNTVPRLLHRTKPCRQAGKKTVGAA